MQQAFPGAMLVTDPAFRAFAAIAGVLFPPQIGRMRILDVDELSPTEAAERTPHLVDGERVYAGFASATGLILFTELRILLVQREHLLQEKIETASYPWRQLRHFAITDASEGSRSVLRIWLADEQQPLHLRANPGTDLAALQRLLAARLA
ncbi:hypothetical protein C7I55_21200 [Sphingomonas deserti]|uniref:Bacterial Pleckstrin homology domain-containing protein n=2 Tax=Allosphingosinicella deserti TaxID=2116704 RepID=A0A2P7QI43_9SPHN|nr:hypothetical protein C7I55_21200 [Sphingomonas deserti]